MLCPHCHKPIKERSAAEIGRDGGLSGKGPSKRRSAEHYAQMREKGQAKRKKNLAAQKAFRVKLGLAT